jgi:antitoxin HigA-1
MPRSAIHAGEHLAEELGEIGLSAAEMARQIEVQVNRITSIINGERGITADTPLRLGHWFGPVRASDESSTALRTATGRPGGGETLARLPRRTDFSRPGRAEKAEA